MVEVVNRVDDYVRLRCFSAYCSVTVAMVLGLLGVTSTVYAQTNCTTGTAVSSSASNPGLVADCQTLLAVREQLAGTATLNWNADVAISSWDGVTTDGTPSRVTQLNLYDNELSGSIPRALGNLSNLTRLSLSHNDLTGSIPSELGSLSNLNYLYLSHLQKSGVGVGWQTLVCIFRGESNRQVAFQRRVRRQAVCHSAPWLESEYDAACRCDAKDGPVPVPAGRARIAGDRWQESGRFQFSRRSNWSTVSASTPNIRWHSTLA